MSTYLFITLFLIVLLYYYLFIRVDIKLQTQYPGFKNIVEFYKHFYLKHNTSTASADIPKPFEVTFQDAAKTLYTYNIYDDGLVDFKHKRHLDTDEEFNFWSQSKVAKLDKIADVYNKYEEYVNEQHKTNIICNDSPGRQAQIINDNHFNKLSIDHIESLQHKDNIGSHPSLSVPNQSIPNSVDVFTNHGNYFADCTKEKKLNKIIWSPSAFGDPCKFHDEQFRHRILFNQNLLKPNEVYVCNNNLSEIVPCPDNTILDHVTLQCVQNNKCFNQPDGLRIIQNPTTFIECFREKEKTFTCPANSFIDKDTKECIENTCENKSNGWHDIETKIFNQTYVTKQYECFHDRVVDKRECLEIDAPMATVDHFSNTSLNTSYHDIQFDMEFAKRYIQPVAIWPLEMNELFLNKDTKLCECGKPDLKYDTQFPLAYLYTINRNYYILTKLDTIRSTKLEFDKYNKYISPINDKKLRMDILNGKLTDKCDPKDKLLPLFNPLKYFNCSNSKVGDCPAGQYFSIVEDKCLEGPTSKLVGTKVFKQICTREDGHHLEKSGLHQQYYFHCFYNRVLASYRCPHPYSSISDNSCTFPYLNTYFGDEIPKVIPTSSTRITSTTKTDDEIDQNYFKLSFDNTDTEFTRTKFSIKGCNTDSVYHIGPHANIDRDECKVYEPMCENNTKYDSRYHACVHEECKMFALPMTKVVWELGDREKLEFFPDNEHACVQKIREVPTRQNIPDYHVPILHVEYDELINPLCDDPTKRWSILLQSCQPKSNIMRCLPGKKIVNGYPQHLSFYTTCNKDQPFVFYAGLVNDVLDLSLATDSDGKSIYGFDKNAKYTRVVSQCNKKVMPNGNVETAKANHVFRADGEEVPLTPELQLQQQFECGPLFRFKMQYKDEIYIKAPSHITTRF
jgi:hypothetical protein